MIPIEVKKTVPKKICPICGYRVLTYQRENGKIRWRKECMACSRERLGLPKQYGKALSSPVRRRMELDGLCLTTCSKCGWFGYCHIHHKDTNRDNNNSENFIVLCPNCHIDEHLGKPVISLLSVTNIGVSRRKPFDGKLAQP